MKGLFIPEITTEMFRNGCLESIEALMAEGKIYDIDYQQPCEDAISRKAVLDKLNKLIEVERLQGTDEMGYGRERVSAYESMIFEIESKYLYPSVNPQQPCDDCISRAEAIEAADKLCLETGYDNEKVIEMLEDLPSVTPKEKTGKWILTDVEGNRVWHCNCSECGKDPQDYIGGSENWWMIKNKLPKYCPSCGKRIQEVENGKYNKTHYH